MGDRTPSHHLHPHSDSAAPPRAPQTRFGTRLPQNLPALSQVPPTQAAAMPQPLQPGVVMGTHRMGTADTKHLTTACLGAPCPSDSRPSPLRILQCFQTPRLSFLYNCSALQGVWYLGTSLMPGQTRNTWAQPRCLGTRLVPRHIPNVRAPPQCLGTSLITPRSEHIPPYPAFSPTTDLTSRSKCSCFQCLQVPQIPLLMGLPPWPG